MYKKFISLAIAAVMLSTANISYAAENGMLYDVTGNEIEEATTTGSIEINENTDLSGDENLSPDNEACENTYETFDVFDDEISYDISDDEYLSEDYLYNLSDVLNANSGVSESELVTKYRQIFREYVVYYAEELLDDPQNYSPEIYKLFTEPISALHKKIDAFDEPDLYYEDKIDEILTDIYDLISLTSYLGTCTLPEYKTQKQIVKAMIPAMGGDVIDEGVNEMLETYDDMNEYYTYIFEDKVRQIKNKYKKLSPKTSTVEDCFKFMSMLETYLEVTVVSPFDPYDSDMVVEETVESSSLSRRMRLKKFENEVNKKFGKNLRACLLIREMYGDEVEDPNVYTYYADYNWVYGQSDIDDEKEYQITSINNFVKKVLPKSKKINAKKLKKEKKEAKRVKKKIRNAYNVDVIANLGEGFIEGLMIEYEVEYKTLSPADKEALYEKLTKISQQYDRSLYSTKKQEKMNEFYTECHDYITYYMVYKSDIPSGYFKKVKKKFDSFPTLEKELKKLRVKYSGKLKKYTEGDNQNKYDQKKLRRIIKKVLSKMNKAKTPEDVKAAYTKYKEQIEGTINKFKITVVMHGAGSASESKRLEYGGSYTVEIIPDAGYRIDRVYIDGKLKTLKNEYEFKKIDANHKIEIYFGK